MRIFTGLLSCLIALNSIPVLADQPAEYQQCAIDLCGPATNYSRIMARGTFGYANYESRAFIKGNLDPILDQSFAITLKNKSLAATYADKNINAANLAMSDEQRAFLTTLTYMTSISKIFGEVIKSAGGFYQIDKEKLKAKAPKLTAEEIDSYTTVLNALLTNGYFTTALTIDSISYDNLILAWGPQADSSLLSLKASLAKVLGVLGSAIKQRLNSEVIDKAIQDKSSLTEAEKKIFISTMSTIYRAFGMTDASVIAVTKPINMQLSDAARLLNWSDKSRKLQQALASKKLIASSKHNVRKQCHDAWAQSLATAPSDLRQRQSDKLLDQVKAAGKRILPRYATDEALARANEAVDKMTFSKPLSLPQIQSQLTESFAASLKENKKFEEQLASATSQDTVGYTIMALSGSAEDDANIFESIQNECKGMAPRTFVDAAYRNNNSILTSWQSTLFPEVGVGVLAHELGHIVSYAISAASEASHQGYTNARTCAIEKHALLEQSPDVTKFKQYAEEDWADLFAADVILDIQKSWPYSANYACSLLDTEQKNTKFKSLQIWDPQGIDTHSTSFLRALQTQTALKRPLPASCVQALKPHEKTVIERSCSQ